MGTHPAALSLVIALSSVLLVVVVPATSSSTNTIKNGRVDGFSVDSPIFYISSTMIKKAMRKCSHTVYVIGQGVSDSFPLSCGIENGETNIYGRTFALYENPGDDITLYTDTPSTLVVIKKDECTKRSYETFKGIKTLFKGKTTYSKKIMSTKECKVVKEKIDAKKEENRKKWEQWQKDFDEQMKNDFPPCFPFCDQQKPWK